MTQLIAIIDIGKTNAKLSFVDSQSGGELWSARRANQIIETALARQLDIVAIERWIIETLHTAPHRAEVAAIVPIAHGAAAVLVDEDGEILAAADYEDPRFGSVSTAYDDERDPFALTLSPSLPAGLNLGRQLFYFEEEEPQLFVRVAHILLYPQYWAWRLSGVMATEVTSLGCHSDLWRPGEMSFSALARTHGWAQLFPAKHFAGETLGTVTPEFARITGLDPQCRVVCGIHDSNASYLQRLIERPREQPFVVISSGTWTVVMANRADVTKLRPDRDMLANVDAFGSTVSTARFMGGREYETIAQSGALPDTVSLKAVLQRQAMALPSFASGGPFPGSNGRITGAENMSGAERAALATLYTALMSDLLIESLAVTGDILIDGPLAANALFASLLATWRPDSGVFANPGTDASRRAACYLSGFQSIPVQRPAAVASLEMAGLDEYRCAWRERLPE